MELIESKTVTVEGINGQKKEFVISKIPASYCREIVAKYTFSSLPKIGDYSENEESMFKMMKYVEAIGKDGHRIRLETRELIDNHVTDWEMLAKLELQMMQHNTSFLARGKASQYLKQLEEKAPQLISKILMDSLQQLSQQEKQPLTS